MAPALGKFSTILSSLIFGDFNVVHESVAN